MSTLNSDPTGTGQGQYRQYLPDLSIPRFTTMCKQDAHEYAKDFKELGRPPWIHALVLYWLELLKEPFKGVTNDGTVRDGLFKIQDEGIPIEKIVEATKFATSQLDASQRSKLTYHVDSEQWRTWSNPEFLISHKGVRLDELKPEARDAFMNVLKTSLSPEGYAKAVSAMRINGFLGELVKSPAVMNEFSYNFVLFGEPSTTTPWGISFYGHHLCLNLFFYKTQIIVSPWFTGAEPNEIDEGKYAGTQILIEEERLGLQLMQSLSSDKQTKAQLFKLMHDPAMPPGRWNRDDQRHLCGAYRDNRIVPYEGILVSQMTLDQQQLVLGILNQYYLYLPETSRKLRLKDAESWFQETYFCWIGGFGNQDPFYYRIQSPVVIVEFDHHSGVFLNNQEPAKFHVHTLLRTPNAGDYGHAIKTQVPGMNQNWIWEEDLKAQSADE